MRKKAKKLAVPHSAKIIAKYILQELNLVDFTERKA